MLCGAAIPKTGKLANKFILTANIEASDGGKAIVAGNERVIRARLSDAKFFYETDLKTKLEDRLPKFEQIVFHEKLGTQAERIERIERLAAEIAPLVGADVGEGQARRAARARPTCSPKWSANSRKLQGLMGKYYALAQGEDARVAAASEEHYKPQGPDGSRADRSGVASPSRSPTRSTRWSASGRSTRSRREQRTLMRCAARRWA